MGIGTTNFDSLAKLTQLAKGVYESNSDNDPIQIMDISNIAVKQIFKTLEDLKVDYMIIGGLATVFYGHIRTTKDLDIWMKEVPANISILVNALKISNIPFIDSYLNVKLISGRSILTIGKDKEIVVNFMEYIKAYKNEDFLKCYKRATRSRFQDIQLTIISLKDLIWEKEHFGRYKDLYDVKQLRKFKDEG
ncbi:nucleotidyltransferase [Marinigracilibium pacificum]|uniref:Nucleotidyltransferase n=1 Tax=Marinigracilibium pacificum TaxID=2729599 RepID=A0A848J0L7_9BACT|nr:nucleotidyltransferase [Marinigracilibium pacificum]NMM50333.1 hypothetical protein [Marinigracilibium pacificum]